MGFIKDFINKGRIKSPWVVHYDCGSCNGCDIEILACLTPVHDAERFGVLNIGNPKHADVLVVSGTVNHRNKHVLKNIYDQMSEPKAVIAIGACGLSGGVFHDCYNVVGGVHKIIPVDVYVPGCPPKPEAILDGVLLAVEKVKEKLGLIPPAKPSELVEEPFEAQTEQESHEAVSVLPVSAESAEDLVALEAAAVEEQSDEDSVLEAEEGGPDELRKRVYKKNRG